MPKIILGDQSILKSVIFLQHLDYAAVFVCCLLYSHSLDIFQ